jgi:hypothetical protein
MPILYRFRRGLLATLFVLLAAEFLVPGAHPAIADEPEAGQRLEAFDNQADRRGAGLPAARQSGGTCMPINYNQALDFEAYGWDDFYFDTVIPVTNAYYSPSSAVRMYEATIDDPDHLTDFDDGFGQAFYVPLNTQRLEIEMRVAYADDGSAGDSAIFELYEWTPGDADGNNIGDQALDAYIVPPQGSFANNWFLTYATITDPAVLEAARGEFIVLTIGTLVDKIAPFQDIYLDDILVRSCTSATTYTGTVGGMIVKDGAVVPGLANAELALVFTGADGSAETVATTKADEDGMPGAYLFKNVAPLGPGESYQVRFVNYGDDQNPSNSAWLYSYDSLKITQFDGFQELLLPLFDISNVTLNAPADEASVVFPVTFQWSGRDLPASTTTSGYKWCLYDLETNAEICSTAVLTQNSFTLAAADVVGVTFETFEFQYNRPYAWYVQVIGKQYDSNTIADVGFSNVAQLVTFVEQAPQPVNQNPSLSLPGGGGAIADSWTVMIYLAGDNDLGSPVFLGNMREQYANLQRIAPNYRGKLNLVTLADFDENGDTRYCVLTAETPCATPPEGEREKDTADPQVLSNFISTTMAAFESDRYMLVIASHGHMVNGIVIDETTPGAPSLSPKQVRDAITAGLAPSGKKLDLLFYNACLMGGLEAAFDASANANYLVAASDQLWVVDVYQQLLDAIVAHSNDPAAIATRLVDAYRAVVERAIPSVFTSIAAYDLARVAAVRTALSALADELRRINTLIDDVRREVQIYDSSGDDKQDAADAFVDLQDLARRLADNTTVPDATVNQKARELLGALGVPVAGAQVAATPLVIASRQVSSSCTVERNLQNASGLMVYFPSKSNFQPSELNDYRDVYDSFHAGSSWDDFVVGYVDRTATRAPGSRRRGALPVGGGVPGEPQHCTWVPLLGR